MSKVSFSKLDIPDVDLRELVARAWGEGKRSGNCVIYRSRWRPDDDHASFAVYADGYKDFGGTGESGRPINWLRREYGWTFREALEYLHSGNTNASRVGTSLVGTRHTSSFNNAPTSRKPLSAQPSIIWQAHAHIKLEEAEKYLWSDAPDAKRALWYLCTIRGLSEETIRRHHFGYNPRRHSTVYTDEQRKEFVIPAGITIPRIANEMLWAIRVRSRVGNLAEALAIPPDRFTYGSRKDQPLDKYLSMTGSKPSAVPFNADALKRWSHDVLIVEGEFDAALAQQILGDEAVVITMGSATSVIPQEWIDKLKRARHVYSCMDADRAGQAAAQRLTKALGNKHKPLKLPQGKDITEYVIDHGGDLAAWWAERAKAARVGQGWWIGGVPDSVRSAVLTYLYASAAPILERLNEALNAGLLDRDHITIPIFKRVNLEQGWGFAPATIDRGIEALEEGFLSKLPPSKSLSIEENNLTQGRGKSDKNPLSEKIGGRPATIFVAMSLSEAKLALASHARPRIYEFVHPMQGKVRIPAHIAPLLNVFEQQTARRRARSSYKCFLTTLDQSACTPITGEYKNAAAYRHQFIRAQTSDREQRGCPRRSRKDIAFTLGVDVRSVKSTLDRAGVISEMQFEDVLITRDDKPIYQQVEAAVRTTHGFPRWWIVKSVQGEEQFTYNSKQEYHFVDAHIGEGKEIYLRLQVTSKRSIATHFLAVHPLNNQRPVMTILGAYARIPKSKVRSRKYYGTDFDPKWIKGQLLLRLELTHGWQPQPDNKLVNPDTGELVGWHMSVEELTEVIRANYGYTLKFDASFLDSVFGDI